MTVTVVCLCHALQYDTSCIRRAIFVLLTHGQLRDLCTTRMPQGYHCVANNTRVSLTPAPPNTQTHTLPQHTHTILWLVHILFAGASAAQPGLRINLCRGGLLSQFPDALAPYVHDLFGCTMQVRCAPVAGHAHAHMHFRQVCPPPPALLCYLPIRGWYSSFPIITGLMGKAAPPPPPLLQGPFDGTLFRFPLRDTAAAAVSDIKATATTPADALALLVSLRDVLPHALLFLKSVRTVDVLVLDDNDGGAAAPRLLFQAALEQLDGARTAHTVLLCCHSISLPIFVTRL